jgi:tryptophan halogenase
MAGLGLTPKTYDPLIDLMDLQALRTHFDRVRDTISRAVQAMPDHGAYVSQLAAEPTLSGLAA